LKALQKSIIFEKEMRCIGRKEEEMIMMLGVQMIFVSSSDGSQAVPVVGITTVTFDDHCPLMLHWKRADGQETACCTDLFFSTKNRHFRKLRSCMIVLEKKLPQSQSHNVANFVLSNIQVQGIS
jgi:hypothetical protein